MQRQALEATMVWKFRRFITLVSTSCACGSGAVMRRMGSCGKHTRAFRHGMDIAGKAHRSEGDEGLWRETAPLLEPCEVALEKWNCSRKERTCSSPAAMKKFLRVGNLRTKIRRPLRPSCYERG